MVGIDREARNPKTGFGPRLVEGRGLSYHALMGDGPYIRAGGEGWLVGVI